MLTGNVLFFGYVCVCVCVCVCVFGPVVVLTALLGSWCTPLWSCPAADPSGVRRSASRLLPPCWRRPQCGPPPPCDYEGGKKTEKKDVVKGESELQRITDHYNCPRRDGNGFQHRRLLLHWLCSQDFSNYHVIVAHRRSSRGGIDSRRPDNYVSDKLEGRKRGEMLHGFKQRPLIIIGQIKVLTYLFIRTCESLTMMFHLFGPDSTWKGMIYEGRRNSKKYRFSCSNRWHRKWNHVS